MKNRDKLSMSTTGKGVELGRSSKVPVPLPVKNAPVELKVVVPSVFGDSVV